MAPKRSIQPFTSAISTTSQTLVLHDKRRKWRNCLYEEFTESGDAEGVDKMLRAIQISKK